MGNYSKEYKGCSTGYDPKAVEHDLQMISQLTHGISGRKKMTMHQAQEIYYKIKKNNICFLSETGQNFLSGLYENMTAAQMQEIDKAIQRKRQKKQNRKRLVSINRKIACVVSTVVLVSSIVCINWNLLMDLRTNYQTKKLQEKILEASPKGSGQFEAHNKNRKMSEKQADEHLTAELDTMRLEEQSEGAAEILPKFTQLYEENQDFVGWLRIPGTKIDYPVMTRNGDNDYYLDKNFHQQHDKNGLLILDYRNHIDNRTVEAPQNFIIYGHNMRTGVMFGTLKNYKDKTFCDEHMTIRFDTLYEESEYRVAAAMLSGVAYEDEDVFRYYDAIDISTEENFKAFQENVLGNAIYTTEETLAYGDTCLILSTCDNYKEDGRFVLVAKKVS
ncbi:MAG: class B sortase [Lachnospiraceae bacterium]|nr:class B sortase [Lachnospiraceae bacterium]